MKDIKKMLENLIVGKKIMEAMNLLDECEISYEQEKNGDLYMDGFTAVVKNSIVAEIKGMVK